MSERRYKLLNGYTLLVDDEGLSVSHHASILTIETSGDEIIDDVLALLDHTVSEKEKWRKEAGSIQHQMRMTQPVQLYTSIRRKLIVSNWSSNRNLSAVPKS